MSKLKIKDIMNNVELGQEVWIKATVDFLPLNLDAEHLRLKLKDGNTFWVPSDNDVRVHSIDKIAIGKKLYIHFIVKKKHHNHVGYFLMQYFDAPFHEGYFYSPLPITEGQSNEDAHSAALVK